MPYETDERVAELTERLENGVRELYASDSYAQYITAMAKFHHYSFGNALLILFQCPHATNVAGYNTWTQLLGWALTRFSAHLPLAYSCARARPTPTPPCSGSCRPSAIM